ncbi:flagellar biosynthesis anti-sigma factor FlgM [Thermaerobacter sp. PB12/4term]|uniref:flagellar biosynthesis anti-sigma factor FlgM n=1 Tax=Thermaerobacter sp. PB12/4term TaxID=2293838 RepID=UPI000E3294BB|nr:flagellar biosynthesis anti-sigma factor FlgM [Thermaerobacter sp. PB12/4term]QIA26253.1 flagellar biosynthesis anti-sigma factor FlgM [Thermaerobacter sp. PB12/4term]
MIISRQQVLNALKAYGMQPGAGAPAAGPAGSPGPVQPAAPGVSSGTGAAGAAPVPGRDRVDLSPAAAAVQRLVDETRGLPEVRAERVAALRAQIARGEYRIDPQQVAERMLYRLLADRVQEDR